MYPQLLLCFIEGIRQFRSNQCRTILGFLTITAILFCGCNTFATISCKKLFENLDRAKQSREDFKTSLFNRPIDIENMNGFGYDIIDIQKFWNSEQIENAYAFLKKRGKLSFPSRSYKQQRDYYILRDEIWKLQYLPENLKIPLEIFLNELLENINARIGVREGTVEFSAIALRDYSRDDLANTFHVHEGMGYFSVGISFDGPGPMIALNPKNHSPINNSITLEPYQLVIMSDAARSKQTSIPATPHGSPWLKKDQSRLILLIEFKKVKTTASN